MGRVRVGMVGGGCVAFATLRDALGEIGYSGIGNIEQDIDPSGAADPLADAIDSRRFLERCGIATPSR